MGTPTTNTGLVSEDFNGWKQGAGSWRVLVNQKIKLIMKYTADFRETSYSLSSEGLMMTNIVYKYK